MDEMKDDGLGAAANARQAALARLRAGGMRVNANGNDAKDPRAHLLSEVRQAAEGRIKKSVFGTAEATKAELDRLGAELAKSTSSVLLTAPIKGMERAQAKVKADYEGHWLDLKDVARITLIAPDALRMLQIVRMIRAKCTAANGYSMVKDVYTDPNIEPCGYSGYNFVIRFGARPPSAGKATGPMHNIQMSEEDILAALRKPAEIPLYVGRFGEIQVNCVPVMYGKMSRNSFIKNIGSAQYLHCRAKFGVDGGAGHVLYEIYRAKPATAEGRAAAALSRRYYRRLSMLEARPSGVDTLREEVARYCGGH